MHRLWVTSHWQHCSRGVVQVMILDWDVHHGNGTNDLFYDDDSVLMIDMHEDGVWPGSGLLTETGSGRGQGHTINIPMPSRPACLPVVTAAPESVCKLLDAEACRACTRCFVTGWKAMRSMLSVIHRAVHLLRS